MNEIDKYYAKYATYNRDELLKEVISLSLTMDDWHDSMEATIRKRHSYERSVRDYLSTLYKKDYTFLEKCKIMYDKFFGKTSSDYIRKGLIDNGLKANKLTLFQKLMNRFKRKPFMNAKEQFKEYSTRNIIKDIIDRKLNNENKEI